MKFYEKGEGFASIYGSSKIADDFNLKYEVYKAAQDVDAYTDPSFTVAK